MSSTPANPPTDIVLYVVAFFIPPLAVFLSIRDISEPFWINILLWILGWLPGVLHAWYVIYQTSHPPPPVRSTRSPRSSPPPPS